MNIRLFVLMSAHSSGLEALAGGVFIATLVVVVRIIIGALANKTNTRKKWDDIDKK
ncbi:MAG: hypothetical protein II394_05445 [Bacteroidales bacterium]|nr:hypothetical protein [Bacteroidales bacterium]